MRFISQIKPSEQVAGTARWLIFKNDEILLYHENNEIRIPLLSDIQTLKLPFKQEQYLGLQGDIPCFAAEIDPTLTCLLPGHLKFERVRQIRGLSEDESLFLLISRAMQVLYWDRRTQFCGACGTRTEPHEQERSKVCPACRSLFYPPISPAMVVLVWRENEILLGRPPHFMPDVYSILAGFVDAGESVEACVEREVMEEVGVSIQNIRYLGSQPWPFPSNLMLGFSAEYAGGEICIDPVELEDAQWFSIDRLPTLPNPLSLSRHIIEQHIAQRRLR